MVSVGFVTVAQPVVAQPVAKQVEEHFTGAEAKPQFLAVGSACLTGAPAVGALRVGTQSPHPLTGCPRDAEPVAPAAASDGYLQLTGAGGDQAGAVLYNQAIPAEQGLDLTFEQWQQGATAQDSSNGISFFLLDGDTALATPGSVDVAQQPQPAEEQAKSAEPDQIGGGLDLLTDYDWQRAWSCADKTDITIYRVRVPGPGTVTARVLGDGEAADCLMSTTMRNTAEPQPVVSALATTETTRETTPKSTQYVSVQRAQELFEGSRRLVNVRITPAPQPLMTLSIDFNDGRGMQQVMSMPAPTVLPPTFKFGLAASDGPYLVRNVTARPLQPRPALTLVKRAAADAPPPDPAPVGATVVYEYVVTNTGNTQVTDLTVNDEMVGDIQCPRTTLGAGETVTCRGSYTVTKLDATYGSITDVASATGSAGEQQVTSPDSQVTLRVADADSSTLKLARSVVHPRMYRPGETVVHRYVVTNDSNRTVNNVRIVDSHATNVTCRPVRLTPGAATTCTGTYVVPNGGVRCEGGLCRYFIPNIAVATAGDLTSAPASGAVWVERGLRRLLCEPWPLRDFLECPAVERVPGVLGLDLDLGFMNLRL